MRSFCTAKVSHIFSTKNIGIFKKLMSEYLTALLVLNNRGPGLHMNSVFVTCLTQTQLLTSHGLIETKLKVFSGVGIHCTFKGSNWIVMALECQLKKKKRIFFQE